jgi:N-acetylglucosaminyldiphosphoundecaprenol N-acetyl-beta-D-mannosaminyltransferase
MAPKACLLGVWVDALDTPDVLSRVEHLVDEGRGSQICYVNVHCMNLAMRDEGYRQILESSDMVYPDGMGVVWACRFFSSPLPERVNLGDCLPELCELCRKRGYRLFLLGGHREVADRAARRLSRDFPGLQIVGTHHGFFSSGEEASVLDRVRSAKPHVLLVGMGVPKQEKWISRHRGALEVPVLWGVGALFEYFAGVTRRAPTWVRRWGLEWLFRLIMEPGRLWRRYLVGNVSFVLRVGAHLFADAVLIGVSAPASAWLLWRLEPAQDVGTGLMGSRAPSLVLSIAVWLLAAAGLGLYRRLPGLSLRDELARAFAATLVWFAIAAGVTVISGWNDPGWHWLLLNGATVLVLLTIARFTFWRNAVRKLT